MIGLGIGIGAAGKSFPITFILGAAGNPSKKLAAEATKMQKIAHRTASIGKAMTLGVTAPILGVGTVATKQAIAFHDQMANVATVIDTNVEDINAMGAEVLKIGERTPVGIEELTAALGDLRSSGIGAEDQFLILEKSAQLAVAGLGTTAEAADIASSAINAFGLEGEEVEKLFSNIFAAVQVGKMSISQLAQGFGSVAGIVASSGTKIDDYLAAVGALTTTGLPAAEAHTQLRAAIAGLTRDTQLHRQVFRKLGAKDFPDLIQKAGGLVPALQGVTKALGGNQIKMRQLLGSSLALNAVIGLSGEQAAAYTEGLELMRGEHDVLAVAFQKKNEQTAAHFQRTTNQLQASAIRLGTALLPIADRLATSLEKAVAWYESLSEGQKEFVLGLAVVSAAAGPMLVMVSLAAKAATAIKALTTAKTAAAAAASAGAAANATLGASFLALVAPIAAVTAALGALWLAWDQASKLEAETGGLGVTGTIAEMWRRGTWNPFEAIDARANELARAEAGERETEQRWRDARALAEVPEALRPPSAEYEAALALARGGEAAKSETSVKVEFTNAPPGTRASVAEQRGSASVDLSMGIAAWGTG